MAAPSVQARQWGGQRGPPHPIPWAPSLRGALEVIRQHHERFDGHGYPDGLAGEQISLAARIVAVVDVWDALTSDRAHRPAWPPDRALRHLVAAGAPISTPTA